jgi:hypothetical protein
VPTAIAYAVLPSQRRVVLLSAICAAPAGLADAIFVPEYWTPGHMVGAGFSVEGLLFSFGNGGMLWALAVWPFRRSVSVDVSLARLLPRYVMWMAIGLAICAVAWVGVPGGIGIMEAALLALVLVGAGMLALRSDAWPFAVSGAVGFGGYYALQLAIVAALCGECAAAWAPSRWASATFLGFPLEELAWAVAYGATWAIATAYGSDVRIMRRAA